MGGGRDRAFRGEKNGEIGHGNVVFRLILHHFSDFEAENRFSGNLWGDFLVEARVSPRFCSIETPAMTSSREKFPAPCGNPERLLELLSVSFDSEISPGEAEEFEVLCQLHGLGATSTRVGYSQIRDGLQSQPVKPVSGLLFTAAEYVKPVRVPSALTGWISGRAVSVLAGVLTMCLVMMWGLASWIGTPKSAQRELASSGTALRQFSDDPREAMAQVVDARLGVERGLERIRETTRDLQNQVEELQRAPVEFSGGRSERLSKSRIPTADMAREPVSVESLLLAGALNAAGAEGLAEVRTLVDAAEWKVVVVKVGSHGRGEIVDKVGIVLSRYGLELEQSGPESTEGWLGVVLTPRLGSHRELIQEVEVAVGAPVEWDPAEVLSSTREQIIAAVRQSLKSPTESELKRGEIFVAVTSQSKGDLAETGKESAQPQESLIAGKAPVGVAGVKADSAGSAGSVEERIGAGVVNSTLRDSGSGVEPLTQKVTLVVFEFGDPEKNVPGGGGIRKVF